VKDSDEILLKILLKWNLVELGKNMRFIRLTSNYTRDLPKVKEEVFYHHIRCHMSQTFL
jgi:hypothetical protein